MKHVERLDIAPDHPAYPDHFPGAPILPGVVLLDAALHTLETSLRIDPATCRIAAAKFHAVVRPGDPLQIEYEVLPGDSIRFSILSADRAVATGMLTHAP